MTSTADHDRIQDRRPTQVRYAVLAGLLVITAINYVQRNSIGPAETTLRADLGLSIAQTGDAISDFFLAYSAMQIPSGWLAQRWGPRRALAVFAAGWSLAMLLLATATGMVGLRVDRLAMGALQAGIFPCATLVLAAWFPASQRGLLTALLNSFMLVGGAAGAVVSGVLVGYFGWRGLFALYALPGLVWAVCFAVWFRNRPEQHPSVNNAELALIRGEPSFLPERPPPTTPPPLARLPEGKGAERLLARSDAVGEEPLRSARPPAPEAAAADVSGRVAGTISEACAPAKGPTPWGRIFLSAALWLICLQQFCRAGAYRFSDTWLPTYLHDAWGQDVARAGLLSSLPQWAGVVGGLVGGLLSDAVLVRTRSRRASRQGVAIAGLLAGVLCYALAYLIPDVNGAMGVMSLGAFLATFASPCAYALTMDMGGKNLGVVFGTMNMAGNLGAYAFVWVASRLVSVAGWGAVLAVFAGLHVAAAVLWMLLDPNGVIGERPVPRHEE